MPTDNTYTPGQQQIVDTLDQQCSRAREMVAAACAALGTADAAGADQVIAADAQVDAIASSLHDDLAALLTDHVPDTSEVQFSFAGVHINLHIERIADYAVTIAKMAQLTQGMAGDPLLLADLRTMHAQADAIIDLAMEAVRTRNVEMAQELVARDQIVNEANRTTVVRLLDLGADATLREWSLRMLLVSRCLERIGDHAVDVGEQVTYLVTGEALAFTAARSEDEESGG